MNFIQPFIVEQAECTTYGRSRGIEWRYSFSQAEIILSDWIPAPARTAFLAFKAVNKRYVETKGRRMGSYVLKCILLRLVESKTRAYWNGEICVVVEAIFM